MVLVKLVFNLLLYFYYRDCGCEWDDSTRDDEQLPQSVASCPHVFIMHVCEAGVDHNPTDLRIISPSSRLISSNPPKLTPRLAETQLNEYYLLFQCVIFYLLQNIIHIYLMVYPIYANRVVNGCMIFFF